MPKLAENLVRDCLKIRPDDNVTVFFYPQIQELADDIAVECSKVGADVLLTSYTDRYYEAFMKYQSVESLRKPSVFCRGLAELATAQFWLGGLYDPAVFRKFSAEKMAANDEAETAAHWPITMDRKIRSLFVSLGLVTRPRAKAYGFSFPTWERMVREASAVKPASLTHDGRWLAKILESGDRVHVTGDGTDLEFSVRGRKPLIYDGVVDEADIEDGALEASIPAGSVTIPPIETSASGRFETNVPQAWAGRSIRRVQWTFADGRVTAFGGDANALRLKRQWEMATGDRDRIGGLTIGLNPKAKLGFLQNSIVRGAVSIAIGMNEPVGGANKSSFYTEHTVRNATVEVDGMPIVQGGKLVG